MKICDKLKSIFKSSDKNNENKFEEKRIFGEITDTYIYKKTDLDVFKNKCEKEMKKLIKNISSLSKEKRENEVVEYSKTLELCKSMRISQHLGGDLVKKYEILYDCIKQYYYELKKD